MGLKHLWIWSLVLLGMPRASVPPYVCTETDRFLQAPERFPNGAHLVLVENGIRRPLAPEFFASADPDVSFDGQRILFSGKPQKTDPWQIWEVPVAGGTPRAITRFAEDAFTPHYLPDDKVVYARSTSNGSFLEVLPLAGGTPDRLTYAPGYLLVSDVLADGRILFEGPHPASAHDLFTVNPDGTFVESYRCDHGHDRHSGRQVASGDIIFQEGARLARFTSALAQEVAIPLPAARFAGPVAEIAPGQWLVAAGTAADGALSLHRLDCAARTLEKVPGPAAPFSLQPVLVAPRPTPLRYPSALMPVRGAGNLLCLNAYVSKTRITEGAIGAARFYTRTDAGTDQLLGEAPVEHDGSFYVQVPPDRPIRMELADRSGRTLVAEHGWFWMRRGEQRVCVGCHAGPERSPENAVPEVLLRSTVPVKFAGGK